MEAIKELAQLAKDFGVERFISRFPVSHLSSNQA